MIITQSRDRIDRYDGPFVIPNIIRDLVVEIEMQVGQFLIDLLQIGIVY